MIVNTRQRSLISYTTALCLGLLTAAAAYSQPGEPPAPPPQADPTVALASVAWIHGSADCENSSLAADYQQWQQIQFQENSYVFRQNKCSHYEGPFVYLFVGTERAVLIDSGATASGGASLLQRVRSISELPLIVAHSHGHSDHRLGDAAFGNAEDITVVATGQSAVQDYFGFNNWPLAATSLDLGGRVLQIMPIPGHSDDDLAFYDPQTEVLVTGDSLYPGRLYVRDWNQYRDSIGRLAAWLEGKTVTQVLGTHIEMSSTANSDYPVGTTFQPDEHPLPLRVEDISLLRDAMAGVETPQRIPLGSFIVWPLL